MRAVGWETYSLSAKGRADNHVKQKCTHSRSAAVTEETPIAATPIDSEHHLHIIDQEKIKKRTSS